MSQSSPELSMIESLSNGDTSLSELQQEDHANTDVTRYGMAAGRNRKCSTITWEQ